MTDPRPLSTDELPDRLWGRPAARLLVRLLVRTPLTANQVTGLATAFGVAGGLFLGLGEGWAFAGAAALYLALDCADGQMARLGRGGGVLGRVVDGVGDYVTAVAIHLGLIAWIAREHGALPGVLWGVAAGASMSWNSFLLDRYKRRFRGDVDDLEAVRAAVEASRGIWKPLFRTFLPYARGIAGDGRIPDRAAYRERVRLPMALFLQAGPTMHVVALAVLAVLGEPRLYAWVAVGPFNVVAVLALLLQAALERREPAVVREAGPAAAAP